jgi:hypothetical protein
MSSGDGGSTLPESIHGFEVFLDDMGFFGERGQKARARNPGNILYIYQLVVEPPPYTV